MLLSFLFLVATIVSTTVATINPPTLLQRVEPVYPQAQQQRGEGAELLLVVTVSVLGEVQGVEVTRSGGAAFDTAAIEAVKQWRFSPATQDGQTIVSRVAVPIAFATNPKAQAASQPFYQSASQPVTPVHEQAKPVESPAPNEVAQIDTAQFDTVVRDRRVAPRSTSDFVLDKRLISAAPAQSGADLLRAAPGVYVSKPEGDAVAHQIFLRGFDAEHGQDIEFSVAGVPVNRVSHIHGQGYSDLNFVLPEVVQSVRVSEGVYDPHQGDFAVAGSIAFELGVPERGLRLRSSYGSFNSFRQVVVFAPRGQADETFGAVVLSKTDGFGTGRSGMSGGAIGQYAFAAPLGFRGVLHLAAYGARAGLAGFLRRDDIANGSVNFLGQYDDPSARAQSAFSARVQTSLALERIGDAGEKTIFQLSYASTSLSMRQNFTGYLQRAVQNPAWVGRGDLIEQRNLDHTLHGQFSHRFARYKPVSWFELSAEIGASVRADWVTQAQNLLQQPRNETWDKRVDAVIEGQDTGAYADVSLRFGKQLHLRGGVRADVLHYFVDDKLGNFTPSYRSENYYLGYRRTALGAAVGPRVSLEYTPAKWAKTIVSYGEGYRSPQARILNEGENAPFAKVRSTELGTEFRPLSDNRWVMTAAGYATWLSDDLIFEAQEGRLERIGPTTRLGAVGRVQVQPWPWLMLAGSVTYVHASLDEPLPATPENPVPPFSKGELLPYVPPVVYRLDASLEGNLVNLGRYPLHGRLGLGVGGLSARPLPYGQWSPPFATVDMQGALRYRFVELGVEVFNAFDARYASNELAFVSNWPNRSTPSLVPMRHVSAGAPFGVHGVLSFYFF